MSKFAVTRTRVRPGGRSSTTGSLAEWLPSVPQANLYRPVSPLAVHYP